MKKLAMIIVLIGVAFGCQAKSRDHFRHGYYEHEQGYNNSTFWNEVSERCDRQSYRIAKGIDKGQLTRREAKKLRREQKHVAKQIRHFKRHQYISFKNKRNVMEHLDYLSEKIRSLKHNDRYEYHNHKSSHQEYGRRSHGYNNWNNRIFSTANSDYSAGIYFRF